MPISVERTYVPVFISWSNCKMDPQHTQITSWTCIWQNTNSACFGRAMKTWEQTGHLVKNCWIASQNAESSVWISAISFWSCELVHKSHRIKLNSVDSETCGHLGMTAAKVFITTLLTVAVWSDLWSLNTLTKLCATGLLGWCNANLLQHRQSFRNGYHFLRSQL